jgi:hypothetical protein
MRKSFLLLTAMIFLACGLTLLGAREPLNDLQAPVFAAPAVHSYLGFDLNQYPGDAALPLLRQTFSFSGYWLNAAPEESSNSWRGKREIVKSNGFGFLVLFNGRMERELKSVSYAKALGTRDGAAATEAARKDQFPTQTIIFLDQEEGGRMSPVQRAYIYAWSDAVSGAGFRAGVYCSGIVVRESARVTITTADDLRENAGGRKIEYFVYNDACPPSPGCAFPKDAPAPKTSGTAFATVWQFAQSPRRKELTRSCPSKYDADGNCYAPLVARSKGLFVDLESADSADPSDGRR